MFEDGLSYPFEGEEAVKNMMIGGGLLFLNFLFIPVIIVYGYYIAVIRTTVQGYDQPPAFQDWETLLVDGLKGMVIASVYLFVPVTVFVVLLVFLGAATGSESGVVAGLGMVFVLLAVALGLLVGYVVPAALASFAVQGSLTSGFDFDTITTVVTHVDYLKAYVMAFAVNFIVGIVTLVLILTIIGGMAVPWVSYYGRVAIFRMYGTAYASATSGQQGGDAAPARQQQVAD